MIDEPWDAADEDDARVVSGRPAHRRQPRARGGGAGGGPSVRERRRWLVVGVVAASVVLAGAVSGAVGPPGPPRAALPGSAADGGMALVVSAARSSAWYCAGPLPTGAGSASALVLTSTTRATVSGRVTVTTSTGHVSTLAVVVPPRGSVNVPMTSTGPPAWASASILLNGGGVGVTQLAGTYGATSDAACQVVTSSNWDFPAGSTDRGADVELALLDPTASPAVVSLSFAASEGVLSGPTLGAAGSPGTAGPPIAPPSLQGLTVSPGQLLVLDVGRQVQLHAELATAVVVTSGTIVAGEWSRASVGNRPEGDLVEGVPQPRAAWWFPSSSATAARGLTTGYWLFNPSGTTAHSQLLLSLQGGATSSISVVVPPLSLVVVEPPPPAATAGRAAGATAPSGWCEVVTSGGPGLVVGRGQFVVVNGGSSAGTVAGAAPVGFPGVVLGAPAPGKSWLLTGPVAAPVASGGKHAGPPAGAIVIAAPGPGGSVTATVYALDQPTGTPEEGTPSPIGTTAPLLQVVVPAGETSTVPVPSGTALGGDVLVVASGPVVVERDYPPVGSVGSRDSMAIPVD